MQRDPPLIPMMCRQTGMCYVPPYGWLAQDPFDFQPLSHEIEQWLKEGAAVEISDNSDGSWTIDVRKKWNDIPCLWRMSYEPAKGGYVTRISGCRVENNEGLIREIRRSEVVLEQQRDGQWTPKLARYINLGDKDISVTEFSDFEINPPVADDDFRLEFPPGAHVTDYAKHLDYRVAESIDLAAAAASFRKNMDPNRAARSAAAQPPPAALPMLTYPLAAAAVFGVAVAIALFAIQRRR